MMGVFSSWENRQDKDVTAREGITACPNLVNMFSWVDDFSFNFMQLFWKRSSVKSVLHIKIYHSHAKYVPYDDVITYWNS